MEPSAAGPAPTPQVPDVATLARATLTFCLDGAEPMMQALVEGAGGPVAALRLLSAAEDGPSFGWLDDGETGDGTPEAGAGFLPLGAEDDLTAAFLSGARTTGRRVTSRGLAAFRSSARRWASRLAQLPSTDRRTLSSWFTVDGAQWIVAPHHRCWPRQLDDLSQRTEWTAPLCLWGLGDPLALVGCPAPVAIVGSRGADDYGRAVARDAAYRMALQGHLVVSGGAMGVDAAAHRGALEAAEDGGEGRTAAVFAGGLSHRGPSRNARLFDAIGARGGAMVSELCPGTVPEARRFLLRNRIIAALASVVLVAQARLRSGALNTAGWACELGRVTTAVPGDITMPANAGCNRAIRDGKALLLSCVDDLDALCHAPHGGMCPGEGPQTTSGAASGGETAPDGEPAALTGARPATPDLRPRHRRGGR